MADYIGSAGELHAEQLVAEDLRQAIWLRLRRLTSSNVCSRVIAARKIDLSAEVATRKGQEAASSIRSALGYWESQPASLNAKVLTRYYALLQITIAEQVADPRSTAGLREIQSHTEAGHGLWTMADPEKEFPSGYMIACRNRGHFYEYCRFRGIDVASFASKARPEQWDQLREETRTRLVSLADMFRRIPELQSLLGETLGVTPLSFHVGHAAENMTRQSEQWEEDFRAGRAPQFDRQSTTSAEQVTYVAIYPHGQNLKGEYLNSLDLPLKNIRPSSEGDDQPYFVGDVTHPNKIHWSEFLDTYKSGYCGTSIIVPVWGKVADPLLIHFITLYALSIVVRYLPLLWHEIEDGNLNHVRALIEQYLAIVDNVLPQIAIERITGRRLIAVQPGSLFGPL
jgi:hypothetical protein